MKKSINIISAAFAAVILLASCGTERIRYSGPSYVGFADTLNTCPVTVDNAEYQLAVASTVVCGYDRTYGVEVLPKGSTAIYGRHYEIMDQAVTIKAGENVGYIRIKGNYDMIDPALEELLVFNLRLALVNPEEEWDLYGVETKVQLQKVCPFDLKTFINWSEHEDGAYGWCIVQSSFLEQYSQTLEYERLCRTYIEDEENNIVRVKGLYYDKYDILIQFDNSNPLDPKVRMTREQVVADTRDCFNTVYGNGEVLAVDTPGAPNYFDSCLQYAVQYVNCRVAGVGMIGTFVHVFEWISDEDAEAMLK